MFGKATTIFAVLSVAAQVIATPPACLIAALSNQSNPSDVSSICNSPSAIQNYIASNCGGNQQIAIGDFASVCSNAGVTVATTLPSSSVASASGTTSVSHSSSSTSTSSGTNTSITASSSAIDSSSVSSTDLSSSTGSALSGSSTGTPITMTTSTTTGGSTTTPASGVTPTSKTNAGNVARLGMDCLGLAALGMFGAMLAL